MNSGCRWMLVSVASRSLAVEGSAIGGETRAIVVG